MRLIDADALVDTLSVDPIGCAGCPEPEFMDELIDILDTAPTVEPTGDLISREDAMARIANDNVVGGMERINEYNNSTEFNEYLDGISDAITTIFCDVPSADITETETCQKCQDVTDTILNRQGERIKELEASAEAVQIPIKLEKRYPESKDEDITDAFMRGYLAGRSSAEAVQGEWVRKYDDKVNCYWYECDQCGEYRPRNQFGHEYNANFCPNCGAKMHKGGDDE